MSTAEKKLLTVKQAAVRAGVSAALVYQWADERRLIHYRLGGQGKRGKVMIDPDDLDAFLVTCRVTEPPDEDGPLTNIR